jgi:hypothetical protein
MAVARLRENWHSSACEWVRSFIVTTTPNELGAASQPDAGGPRLRDVAGVARRRACRRAPAKDLAPALSGRENDMLACQHARQRRQEQ